MSRTLEYFRTTTSNYSTMMNENNDNYNDDPPLSSLRAPPARHYYLTRRGKILQSTTERYLRDDLGFGSMLVPSTASSSSSSSSSLYDSGRKKRKKIKEETIAGKIVELIPYTIEHVSTLVDLLVSATSSKGSCSTESTTTASTVLRLVVVDTNVLLHHIDVLEYLRDNDFDDGKNSSTHDHDSACNTKGGNRHHAIANAIVIPQTALEECRHRSLVMYRRATDLVRSSSSSTSNSTTVGGNRQRRCVIVFADVHHVDTQIKSFPPESRLPASSLSSNENDDELAASSTAINDENDARLRKVAWFYGRALHDFYHSQEGGGDQHHHQHQQEQRKKVEVVFLSDDAQSRKLALREQPRDSSSSSSSSGKGTKDNGLYYKARSVREHVTLLQKEDPTLNLLDLVANFNAGTGGGGGGGGIAKTSEEGGGGTQGGYNYTPHVASSTLSHGLRTNRYYQGIYRSNRDSYTEGYVTIRRGEDRVAVVVSGREDVNRAVDGDIVAVELFAVDHWLSTTTTTTTATRGSVEANDGGSGAAVRSQNETSSGDEEGKNNEVEQPTSGIAADTAEPSVRDIENITEEVPVDEEGRMRRPVGKVVGIIRRNFHKNFCGSICTVDDTKSNENDVSAGHLSQLHPHDAIAAKHEREHPDGITSTVVFFSIDQRVPPILLRTTQRERLVGMRILVSMDSWPADSEYPLGHYVQTLGLAGTKDTETQVLLQEFRIPCEPFPAKVLACLPPADYQIELEPGRADLRHIPVLSIDPPGCKDIDDALHCIQLSNGNWQVGVHIADVTHYVEAGTAIDLEAANRSTSTYLVNKRLDMLPSLLTTDLCSLKGNVDRFAFSVLWEVTPEATIVDVEFKKSIIHSIAALTYQQAQSLIDKPDKDCRDDIQAGAVKRLALLARKFRARRIAAGALTLASPEVKFVLDSESLNPTDVQAYTLYEANALVEEFMLLANVTVAKKILRHYPTLSILRRHPAPNRSMFDGLIQKAKTRGISLCIDDSKKLADSLDDAGRTLSSDPYLDQLLRILSTRCMSPAQYFCSGEYQAKDWHHYGLAAPVYTHFTSPIRRYADVCVHRLLAAAIGVAPLPVFLSSKSHLHDLAANMNRRHRAAQLAGRASVQLHTLIFFAGGEDEEEGGGAKEEDAYVLDIDASAKSQPSLTVMVPRYGIEGKVRLSKSIKDECLDRNPEKHSLGYKDPMTGKLIASIAVFDKVRVRIWVRKSRDRRELVVDLLEPKLFADPTLQDNDDSVETRA